MRKLISYEMEMMFVGSRDAFVPASNTGNAVSRLDFIQSYGFSFNMDRQPLKQIGSSAFAARHSQLTPDVELDVSYLLNDGWNEKYLGLDFTDNAYTNPLYTILTDDKDRNFYVMIANDQAKDAMASFTPTDFNVLGIGNTYLGSYSIRTSVGQMAEVSCKYVGANAQITNYSATNYVPAVNTALAGQDSQVQNKKYGFNFYNASRPTRIQNAFTGVFDGGCPYNSTTIVATNNSGSAGIKFGFVFDNFQSLDIAVNLERKALYGFGSNYPFARKIQKPIVGTMSLDSVVNSFDAEKLNEKFTQEDVSAAGYDFDILFKNANQDKKLGVKIQNAKLDSYSINGQIGDKSMIQTSWSFEVTESTGILISGAYNQPTLSAIYTNESINP
jgi:hypothetical protein